MKPSVYLDHAATSYPKPECVIDAVTSFARSVGTGAGRGSGPRAEAAGGLLSEVRAGLGELLNAPAEGVVLTSGATQGLNMALLGLLRPGDHVLASPWEHNAVSRPLAWLQQRRGVSVSRLPGSLSAGLDLHALPGLLRPETRMCVLSHVSNVFGQVADVAAVGALLASRPRLLLVVDAAQSAGVLPIDVRGWGVDVLALSGHKGPLGPPGTGALYLRPELVHAVEPLQFGGTGSRSAEEPFVPELPLRLEVGTQNTWGIAGLHAALGHLRSVGVASVAQHVAALTREAVDMLREFEHVELLLPPAGEHHGVLSLRVAGLRPHDVAHLLQRHVGVEVRAGLHCSPWAHGWAGTRPGGTVRASFGGSTRIDDLLALRDGLAELR